MKITETILKPRAVFSKEVRRVDITEVTAAERKELYNVLLGIAFNNKQKCEYQVYVNKKLCSFTTEKEAWHFKCGFSLALELEGILVSCYPDWQ